MHLVRLQYKFTATNNPHLAEASGGDEPVGEEPGATVTTGGASVKSSTEVTLSGSFANLMCKFV